MRERNESVAREGSTRGKVGAEARGNGVTAGLFLPNGELVLHDGPGKSGYRSRCRNCKRQGQRRRNECEIARV